MTVVEQIIAPEVLTERERRARVLEAAALEIEVRGWGTGGKSGNHLLGESVCLVGGITAALDSPLVDGVFPDYGVASEVWGTPDYGFLWKWNDKYARDAADVTFVLRWRAAEIRDGR